MRGMSGPTPPAADVVVNKGGPKRSFPFRGDETLEIIPLGGKDALPTA